MSTTTAEAVADIVRERGQVAAIVATHELAAALDGAFVTRRELDRLARALAHWRAVDQSKTATIGQVLSAASSALNLVENTLSLYTPTTKDPS